MRHYYMFLIFHILLIAGCQDTKPETRIGRQQTANVTMGKPSNMFRSFVSEIAQQNWIHDTARLQKTGYHYLKPDHLHDFNQVPFYYLEVMETDLYRYVSIQFNPDSLLKPAPEIWAYFYRKKDAHNMIPDGVIEEWKFRDTIQAIRVLEYLNKSGQGIWFNTTPFFFRNKQYVYIFHTRAMLFSYDQKPLFTAFQKKFR